MASVGTLAAGLAHEVGNPLGALVGYLDVVKGRLASGGEIRPLIASALEEAGRIDRIVRSVLDFADPSSERAAVAGGDRGAESVVSLSDAVERTVALLEGRGAMVGVKVITSVEPGAYPVRARAQHLEQILMNLLMNAVRAAKEGEQTPEVRLQLYPEAPGRGIDESRAVLEVIDNGPGIHPNDLDRIFDPFFTTRPPGDGTGLGLAITRRIVRELGGKIEALRPDARGARIRLSFPMADGDAVVDAGGAQDE
jgi:signal transduction histidine kinase